MRRLKTIDELYEEVKGYGLVLTNDVALETALNARIQDARIGELAITPRHLTAKIAAILLKEPVISDLRLMSEVSEETGFSLRRVYSEIMNFREIRAHSMNVKPFLGTLTSRIIYDKYAEKPTLEKAMDMLDPEDGRIAEYLEGKGGNNTVAVIAPELFQDLDKHCVPLEADVIDVFHDDGSYDIPEMRMVGNDRELAENAVSLIENDPADYAIVVSAQDSIADSVRSALYRRGLPFVNGMKVSDVPHVRDFIGFVSLALGYRTLRIRQVREMFLNYGGSLPDKTDYYLLSKIEIDPKYQKSAMLRDLMMRICEGSVTYREAKDALCNTVTKPQVSLFLEELGMLDRFVDAETVSEIRFAVENVSELTLNVQKPESERRGVLIADCKNSVFIDRPVVIYIGMEQEWNIPVVGKRYMDAEYESELNAQRLEALLQQGQRRLYCINRTKNGKEPRPCSSFDIISGDSCDHFSDVCGRIASGPWTRPPSPYESRSEDLEHGSLDASDLEGVDPERLGHGSFSKTSFDCFAACPRRFMFHVLIPSSEKTYTQFGNLIHSFAELYAVHPEAVREKGLDALVDLAAERYAGLSSPALEGLDRDRIRSAMVSIAAYIDVLGIRAPADTHVPQEYDNPFMDALGIDTTSSWCERSERMDENHIHGIFDLMAGSIVTDYKTGKASSGSSIRTAMSMDPIAQVPEFQPLIYLAMARRDHGQDVEFDLFFAMENDIAALEPGFDIGRSVRRIRLIGGGALESLASADSMGIVPKLSSRLAPHTEGIVRAIIESGIEDPAQWRSDPGLVDAVLKVCGLSGAESNRKDAASAIGKIAEAVSGGMIAGAGDPRTVLVPTRTLDAFLDYVDRAFEEKEECLRSGFPANPAPAIDCERCEYFDVCTRAMIRISEEADGDE